MYERFLAADGGLTSRGPLASRVGQNKLLLLCLNIVRNGLESTDQPVHRALEGLSAQSKVQMNLQFVLRRLIACLQAENWIGLPLKNLLAA